MENLQIEIRGIHLRYEDDLTYPERPFAAGFYLGSLTAQTCDEEWNARFVQRDPGSQAMAFKLVELNNAAAYLNLNTELYGDLEMTELMASVKKKS